MAYMSPQEMAALPPQLRALYERINAGKTTNNRTSSDAELMGAVGAGLPTQAVTAARQRVVQAQQGAQNQPVIQQGNAGLGGTYGRVDPRVTDIQYAYASPNYQGNARSWIDDLNEQMRYAPQQALEGAGTGGVELPYTLQKNAEGLSVRYMPDGTYQVLKAPPGGSTQTPADMYDAQGNFLGGLYVDTTTSGLGKFIDKLIPIATTAMIGAGAAGAFAGGAQAGAGAGSTGAGAAGSGGMVNGAFLGEGALSGIPAWDGALSAAAGGAGAGGTAAMGANAAGGAGVVPPNPYASGGSWMDSVSNIIKGGGAGGGGGTSALGSLGNIISGNGGASDWLGLGSSVIGGLLGSQGQESSRTSTSQIDPRLAGPVFNDLVPRTQGLLNYQTGKALSLGGNLASKGLGLLGQTAPDTATNPYAVGILDDMQRRNQEMLGQSLQGVRGNFVGVGGLGGSRQGVAEAEAIKGALDNFTGQGFNFMGGLYNQDQNRLRQDWTIGAGLIDQGLNTQWSPYRNAASIYSPFTGTGTSTTTQQQGGGAMGALGGALGAYNMGVQNGWWGNS